MPGNKNRSQVALAQCPTCGALPKDRCRSRTGKAVKYHVARYRRYHRLGFLRYNKDGSPRR